MSFLIRRNRDRSYDQSEKQFQSAMTNLIRENGTKIFLTITCDDYETQRVSIFTNHNGFRIEENNFPIIKTYVLDAIRCAVDFCDSYKKKLFLCLRDCDQTDYFQFQIEQLTIINYQGFKSLEQVEVRANKVLVDEPALYQQLMKNPTCKYIGLVYRVFVDGGNSYSEIEVTRECPCHRALEKCEQFYKTVALLKVLPFIPTNVKFSPLDGFVILIYFGLENQGTWSDFLRKELYDPRLLGLIAEMVGMLQSEDLKYFNPDGHCKESCGNNRFYI